MRPRRASTSRLPGTRSGASRPRTTPPAGTARPEPDSRTVRRRPRFTGRFAILVMVVALLTVSYASSMRAYAQQRAHIESLRHDIATSKAGIAQLTREKKRWHDPAYIRAQAHRRFGWVLPGEITYQVIGADGKPMGVADALPKPKVHADPRPQQWWQSAWQSVVLAGNPKK